MAHKQEHFFDKSTSNKKVMEKDKPINAMQGHEHSTIDGEEKKDSDGLHKLQRPPMQKQKSETKIVDGNWAVASASYRMNDVAYIFPITPSSTMGEIVDEWAATDDEHGEKFLNLWDQQLKVCEMQSEGGAAGALHGALVSGSLATSYTASQGLLLFIPNLYKIAGELLPTVIHVAARALAGQALSIYGDHSDVMLVRATGFAMVSSFTVQEAHDMAIVAQIATLNSRVPFLHFMDGFRTSHEINKIEIVSDDDLKRLIPWDKVEEHRQRALSPLHPSQRGTAQAPDVFFQMAESSNSHYKSVNNIFQRATDDFSRITGRNYNPFEFHYYGTSSPHIAIVAMGSSVEVIKETLKYIKSEQVCVIGVRLFRPWDPATFCSVLPETLNRIGVLDRTKESGAQGEPLYLDVCASLMNCKRENKIFVAGGRYGLASKDFSPRMAMAVIHNMMRNDVRGIQHPFTVGIIDDISHLSLSLGKEVTPLADSVTQCVFWGFGSDGTVGGNKEAVKIIGSARPEMSVQAYFEYDAKKSSGWTISHIRFSDNKQDNLSAPYRVQDGQAQYVACHHESYVKPNKFDVVRYIRKGGTFFLNTQIAALPPDRRVKALEAYMSPKILRTIALRKVNLFIMDATSVARKHGLRGKINMICMMAFFQLSGVLPMNEAIPLLKESITKTYSSKGEDVVRKNHELLDACSDPQVLVKVDIPSRWKRASIVAEKARCHVPLLDDDNTRRFVNEIAEPVSRLEGDTIPISKFLMNNMLGGTMQPGTTRYEKRRPNPGNLIPKWNANACTQCNQCVMVCPHAAIRPFIVTRDEAERAPNPDKFSTVKALGTELAGKRYILQISPLDCTGCTACIEACPESPKALEMTDVEDVLSKGGEETWEYAQSLPERGDLVDKYNVKGSGFQVPLMEFSGACSGCGETPYFKLLTQLFGERMVIANATGCSTIWGGSFPSNPYTVSKKTKRGPAWANSLFEDNAEYGFGMFSAMRHRRDRLIKSVKDYVYESELTSKGENISSEEGGLLNLFREWLDVRDEKSDLCTVLYDRMVPLFQVLLSCSNKEGHSLRQHSMLSQIYSDRDMFPKISQWICGGDGWAYDIGFGGLDHVEAFGSNDVNVLVVDTEMYSNTGGQQSKATPSGASVKFAIAGKQQGKKNLGEMFMTYEHVYVASVCLSNQAQLVQALVEADRHNGPSFVVAYAPCIQQQVRPEGLNDMFNECKFAVDSGYWPLYRYNPNLVQEGKNPFTLDSKKLRREVSAFLKREGRFINLKRAHPEIADDLFLKMNRDVNHRMELMTRRAAGYKIFSTADEASVICAFASETGTAQRLAQDFADACTLSNGATALNDLDLDDIDGKTTLLFIATCGQGKVPQNAADFYHALLARAAPFLEGTSFSIMGLGDSSYYFFCKAAKDFEVALNRLGAKCILPMGVGDDSAEGGMEEGLHAWLENVWPALGLAAPKEVPHINPVQLCLSKRAIIPEAEDTMSLGQYYDSLSAKTVTITKLKPLSERCHNRDFYAFTLDIGNKLVYELGDSLEIFPTNDHDRVVDFLDEYSSDFDERTVIKLDNSFGVHGEISLGSLFTNILDLFGKPSICFMQKLSTFENNEERRQVMLDVNSLRALEKDRGVTYADLLLLYKSARPPLPALLAMIPTIKGRAYSIASSPSASSQTLELCILIDTWWCGDGMRYGLTCGMLRKAREGDSIWCRVKPGSMEGPRHQDPAVSVGIGSGLAPHMSFLRDRVNAAESGIEVAPFSLYFGNRFKQREFLYQDELERIALDHSNWFKLHTAFSRDAAGKKVYVQDLVAVTDDAYDNLVASKGNLYVCGNRNLPKPLQNSLKDCFARHGMSTDEATRAVEDLFLHGRAQQEVW